MHFTRVVVVVVVVVTVAVVIGRAILRAPYLAILEGLSFHHSIYCHKQNKSGDDSERSSPSNIGTTLTNSAAATAPITPTSLFPKNFTHDSHVLLPDGVVVEEVDVEGSLNETTGVHYPIVVIVRLCIGSIDLWVAPPQRQNKG